MITLYQELERVEREIREDMVVASQWGLPSYSTLNEELKELRVVMDRCAPWRVKTDG